MLKLNRIIYLFIFLTAITGCGSSDNTNKQENNTVDPIVSTPLETGHFCYPLPAATGNTVTADPSDVSNLNSIVSNLNTGDTLLLADGDYQLNGVSLRFNTPGVTLRSASGNPDNVVLDGNYVSGEIINIAASNVTIAEITVKRAYTHPIHIVTSDTGDTLNTLIYRVTVIDAREQAIKINPGYNSYFVDSGEIACSKLKLTDAGRPHINPTSGGCYTGGIDAHQARDWLIRDNLIEGYWCASGLSEHAIHFWRGGRDTLVERNIIKDSARGVGFGLSNSGAARTYSDQVCPQSSTEYIGHYGGIVRNNFIIASSSELLNSSSGFDCGICLWSACEASALNNSIFSTGSNQNSSIEIRFSATKDASIYNNLVSHSIKVRDSASGNIEGNIENASSSLVVDITKDDLHLKSTSSDAIDAGFTQFDSPEYDIDGDSRDAFPDVGADEL